MDRMMLASRHMSDARRHLIAIDPQALPLAIAEVRLALEVLGPSPLDSDVAREWVRVLRDAVDGEAFESGRFMETVDALASWLYWQEPASV
jgi:hypothetical protein